MSMSLLYNILKINNTVTIQSSVSMHTDVYSILSFSVTKGALRPVSSVITTHFVRPFELRGVPRSQCTCSLLLAASACPVYVNTH